MRDAFLAGPTIHLRALERTDLPTLADWINDHDVTRMLFTGDRPAIVERLAEQWETEWRSANNVVFAICMNDGDCFVGTTGLYSIHPLSHSAEFRIFIGAKQVWNRGVGTEATKLIVHYGFEKLNLNKVWLGVNAENIGGVRAYEKAGFVREGVLRQEQFRNFRYYDVIRMSILRGEYEQLRDGYLDPEREA